MMFGDSTVTLRILISKAYGLTMTTSTAVYKKDWQKLEKAIVKVHSTYQHDLDTLLTPKYMNSFATSLFQ